MIQTKPDLAFVEIKVGYLVEQQGTDYEYLVTQKFGNYVSLYAVGLNEPEFDVHINRITKVSSPDSGVLWQKEK